MRFEDQSILDFGLNKKPKAEREPLMNAAWHSRSQNHKKNSPQRRKVTKKKEEACNHGFTQCGIAATKEEKAWITNCTNLTNYTNTHS
jgi:hypothetical protein